MVKTATQELIERRIPFNCDLGAIRATEKALVSISVLSPLFPLLPSGSGRGGRGGQGGGRTMGRKHCVMGRPSPPHSHGQCIQAVILFTCKSYYPEYTLMLLETNCTLLMFPDSFSIVLHILQK